MGEMADRASEFADRLLERPWHPAPAPGRPARRLVAIGDPQTTAGHFFAILERHQLLGADGRLAPDVALISMGDHFDFGGGPGIDEGREGMRLLRWLAEHPAEQVALLLGNHDTIRVMEFGRIGDEPFAAARSLGETILALRDDRDDRDDPTDREALAEAEARFFATYSDLPGPEFPARHFRAFRTEQRALVQRLLLAGRYRLALAANHRGRRLLLTHAGVTQRQLDALHLAHEPDPDAIAAALQAHLDQAIERVRKAWEEGRAVPLHLEPLHRAGVAGRQGGGLLYHRASLRRANARQATFEGDYPRRYEPAELPEGLWQACGHTGHPKLLEELAGQVPLDEATRDERACALRTLWRRGDAIGYHLGAEIPREARAALLLVDARMHEHPADCVPVLELDP